MYTIKNAFMNKHVPLDVYNCIICVVPGLHLLSEVYMQCMYSFLGQQECFETNQEFDMRELA